MKKTLSLLLALLLLCGACALASCADADTQTEESTWDGIESDVCIFTQTSLSFSDIPDRGDESVGMSAPSGYEDVDFGGKTFTFASEPELSWDGYEVCVSDESADGSLSAALAKRNKTVCDLYNCKIEYVTLALPLDGEALGNDAPDFWVFNSGLASKGNGNYYNISSFVRLSNPWWDDAFANDMIVDGYLYGIVGNFALSSIEATQVLFFSKRALEDVCHIESGRIYELVDNAAWTIDNFAMLCRTAEQNGINALASDESRLRAFYFGLGGSYITKRDDVAGNTSFALGLNDASALAWSALEEIFGGTPAVTAKENVKASLAAGETLFATGTIGDMEYLNESFELGDNAYGVVPYPAYNREQIGAWGYECAVETGYYFYCVPKTISCELNVIADFLELYGYHSRYISYAEYFNMLQYSLPRSEEDGRMLTNVILKSRRYDIAHQLDLSGIDGAFAECVKNGENPVAYLAKEKGSILQNAAEEYRDYLRANDN